ncbi:MAG TPA: chromosome partitioning protein ParB [Frankiaceae bacterium]|nr:chromosome partitioning protein ParB [Frankiaceae bacterium]
MTSGWRSTGFPEADSRDDFTRARRRAQWARVAARLRGRPGDLDVLLPFDEVVAALGRRGQHNLGEQLVEIDSIVGSVDRRSGFDRRFRPTTELARSRFERIAGSIRRGREMPPVDLYRVGLVHFVKDGHHRIAVARAMGWDTIRAIVTEVETALPAGASLTVGQLPLKGHERVFYERVPLPAEARSSISLRDPTEYAELAEGVEAWGFRVMQERDVLLPRAEIARLWWTEEYRPAVDLLRESGLLDFDNEDGNPSALTETEAYLQLSAQRYRLLRSHVWDERSVDAVSATRRRRRPRRRARKR